MERTAPERGARRGSIPWHPNIKRNPLKARSKKKQEKARMEIEINKPLKELCADSEAPARMGASPMPQYNKE